MSLAQIENLRHSNRESSLDSQLDSRCSPGSRIECQLTFERNCKLPTSLISPPFSGEESPLPSPLLFFTNKWLNVLTNHDCKSSCGLIWVVLFTNWKFGFVFYPRLHDLQLLLRFFTLYSHSLWRSDTIVFAKWNKTPLTNKTPPPPLSKMFEIISLLESLIEDSQYHPDLGSLGRRGTLRENLGRNL